MTGYVFLIDAQSRVEPVLARALDQTLLTIVPFATIAAAKRKLIDEQPALILCDATLPHDPEGGFRFARELSEHESLRSVPLVLIAEQLSEEIIRNATAAGAKSLLPWPVSVESLRHRLKPFLSELSPASTLSEPMVAQVQKPPVPAPMPAGSGTAKPVSGLVAPSGSLPEEEALSRKFALAQHILAKVLHNLRTSALLDVIDLEDVPTVVSEVTRSTCAGSAGAAPADTKKAGAVATATPSSATPSTGLDLDTIFGLKK